MNTTPEFSFLVDCSKLQEFGRTLETEAKASQREALAKRLDLLSLDKLIVKAFVSRQSVENVLLNCNFKAIYKQKCIVSLKPLKKEIDCSFQRIYSSFINEDFEHESEPQQEYIEDSKDIQDPPDQLIDGFFDLGESVAEQLSLEIDPFPRSKGVNFDGFSSYRGEQISEISTNPFAVLEQLKKKL